MPTPQYFKTVNVNVATPNPTEAKLLVIYTGGTIGMDRDPVSGQLVPFDFEGIMEKVPELSRFNYELTVISFPTLIDSSDINAKHWLTLVRLIQDFYDEYDGFVILHGTDTMAYTASVLSYLIEGLTKPVVLTGAQLPIGVTRTDARENLISAMEVAAARSNGQAVVPEVCICFDNVLLRGNRAKKVQNFDFTAFQSYNYASLAIAGIHIDYNHAAILPPPRQPLKFFRELEQHVYIAKLFPGMPDSLFQSGTANA